MCSCINWNAPRSSLQIFHITSKPRHTVGYIAVKTVVMNSNQRSGNGMSSGFCFFSCGKSKQIFIKPEQIILETQQTPGVFVPQL